MSALTSILLVLVLLTVPVEARAAGPALPAPESIKEFVSDPIPPAPGEHFKDFTITRKDLELILKEYHVVDEEHWRHAYSHVAFADRTGHVVLDDGTRLKWFVKPGGLAWIEARGGQRVCLAREKTFRP